MLKKNPIPSSSSPQDEGMESLKYITFLFPEIDFKVNKEIVTWSLSSPLVSCLKDLESKKEEQNSCFASVAVSEVEKSFGTA